MNDAFHDGDITSRQISLEFENFNLNFPFYYYKEKDSVSDSINRSGSWEMSKLQEIDNALDINRKHFGLERHQVTFVDIGANIGWFSTVMAHLG